MTNMKILSLIIGIILSFSFISALEFDNVIGKVVISDGEKLEFDGKQIEYNSLWGKYAPIKIENSFGLPLIGNVLIEGYLDKHTESCSNDCSSEFVIKLYDRSVLLSGLRYKRQLSNGEWIDAQVREDKISIKIGEEQYTEDVYEWQCIPTGKVSVNGTIEQACANTKTGTITKSKDILEEYNLGDIKDAGIYTIRLNGEKRADWIYDWQIETSGIWIEDWATWGASSTLIEQNVTLGGCVDLVATECATHNGALAYDKDRTSSFEFDYGSYGDSIVFYNYTYLNLPYNVSSNITLMYQNTELGYTNVSLHGGTGCWNNGIISFSDEITSGYAGAWWLTHVIKCWNGTAYNTTLYNVQNSLSGLKYRNIETFMNIASNSYIILNSPADYYNSSNRTITFNATANIIGGSTLVNMTLVNISLWHNASGTWARNATLSLTGASDNDIFIKSFQDGNFRWGVQVCDSDGDCGYSSNRTFSVDTTGPTVTITSPVATYSGLTNGQSIVLNYSAVDTNLQACWREYNGANTTIANCANTTFTYVGGVNTIKVWANDTVGNKGSVTQSWSPDVAVYNVTYNIDVYETNSETFTINASGMTSATLNYNGTTYPATISGNIASKTINIPTVAQNRSFFWELNSASYNSSVFYQNVRGMLLGLCNASNNVTYVNFTFKDEETLTSINASITQAYFTKYYFGDGTYYKTLLYSNTTENTNYPFCFYPSDKTLSVVLDTLQYTSAGYYQRSYYFSGTYTNTTTQNTLYLLSTGGYGGLVSFQVATVAISPISGASVTVQREIAGVWTTVGTGSTDSSGLVSFYLSSTSDHIITVSKTGYTTTTVTIRPVQSLYTITLGSGTTGYYNTSLQGIYWRKNPASGIIAPGTYTFSINVTAQEGNMQSCRLNLTYVNGTQLSTSTGTATGTGTYCYASLSYTGTGGQNIYGKYYVTLSDGNTYLLEGDGNWKFISINASLGGSSLKSLINFLSSSAVWTGSDDTDTEEYRRYEFTRIVAFFLIFALILGALNVATNFDINNPGLAMWGFPIIVTIFTIAGGVGGKGLFYIAGATPWAWLDNFIVMFYSWIIMGAIYYTTLRRDT